MQPIHKWKAINFVFADDFCVKICDWICEKRSHQILLTRKTITQCSRNYIINQNFFHPLSYNMLVLTTDAISNQ